MTSPTSSSDVREPRRRGARTRSRRLERSVASPVNACIRRRSPSSVSRRCATRASVCDCSRSMQARLLGAAHELRHRALRELQALGELGDGRLLAAVGGALHHQQQQVALRRQAGLAARSARCAAGTARRAARNSATATTSEVGMAATSAAILRGFRDRARSRASRFGNSACTTPRSRSSGARSSRRVRARPRRRRARRSSRGRSRGAATAAAASSAGSPRSRRSRASPCARGCRGRAAARPSRARTRAARASTRSTGRTAGTRPTPATETTLTTSDGRRRLEPRQERAQAPDAAEVVRAHDGLGIAVEEGRARGDAGVVHEQVNARMPLEDSGRDALDRLPVGDVADLVLAADLLGERPQPILAAGEQHAVPAAAREQACDLRADAGRRAGDDCYPRHTRDAYAVRRPSLPLLADRSRDERVLPLRQGDVREPEALDAAVRRSPGACRRRRSAPTRRHRGALAATMSGCFALAADAAPSAAASRPRHRRRRAACVRSARVFGMMLGPIVSMFFAS